MRTRLRRHDRVIIGTVVGGVLVLVAGLGAGVAGLSAVATPTAKASSSAHTVDRPFGRFGRPLYSPVSQATVAERALLEAGRTTEAAALRTISRQPVASWVGPEIKEPVLTRVRSIAAAAAAKNQIAVLVPYGIPHRDCGGYAGLSAGLTATQYRQWIRDIAVGLGRAKSIVVLEPDALRQIYCLPAAQKVERLQLLRYAVTTLRAQGSWVYLDAGHSAWVPVRTMASRLRSAGIAQASGFSLNVSNFRATASETAYGTAISKLVGGRHFIIDTSRNGSGPNRAQWCNPEGRSLGHQPTLSTGNQMIDAYLWIKLPGQSDGPCNGGPPAGTWWNKYALDLIASTPRSTAGGKR